MAMWQVAALLFLGFGSLGLLLTISKQLDRLIKEVSHLRIEYRNATGVEPAGMTLARERESAAGRMTRVIADCRSGSDDWLAGA